MTLETIAPFGDDPSWNDAGRNRTAAVRQFRETTTRLSLFSSVTVPFSHR